MAKVKITANFRDSEADYSHVDLHKGIFVTVRANVAEQWVSNGWAVIVPESTETEDEDEKKPPKNKKAEVETAAHRGAPETTEGLSSRGAHGLIPKVSAQKRKPK